jgi:histidyl-tRNA synthetase
MKLSTESYKGVRDFYPEDAAVQDYIFSIWQEACKRFGYERYDASVLEPADLYRAKSGEEIVNEQTYTFRDRGDREVTLRPEMTPTVARMVAQRRRELAFPLRWYSIPNLFRYEQPQRGRLREHWQLNADIFGIANLEAEIEAIALSSYIMHAFGAKDDAFSIRINSRKLTDWVMKEYLALDDAAAAKLSKLVDRKEKMPAEDFEKQVGAIITNKTTGSFFDLLSSKNIDDFEKALGAHAASAHGIAEIKETLARLAKLGIKNAVFSPTLMRGFDYYTGIIFEVFDTDPRNRRSLFGGGRYDDLLGLFSASATDKVPAVGFGMGDVTIRDFLETRGLLPKPQSPIDLYLCVFEEAQFSFAEHLASTLRAGGVSVAIDFTARKIGDQIKVADKKHIRHVVCIGDAEVTSGSFKVKDITTGIERQVTEANLAEVLIAARKAQ